jgi:hypothetical protein
MKMMKKNSQRIWSCHGSQLHEKNTNWYPNSKSTSHVTSDVGKLTNIRKAIGITNIKYIGAHP